MNLNIQFGDFSIADTFFFSDWRQSSHFICRVLFMLFEANQEKKNIKRVHISFEHSFPMTKRKRFTSFTLIFSSFFSHALNFEVSTNTANYRVNFIVKKDKERERVKVKYLKRRVSIFQFFTRWRTDLNLKSLSTEPFACVVVHISVSKRCSNE